MDDRPITTSVALRESHRETLALLGRINERTASAEMRTLIDAEAERRAKELAAFRAGHLKSNETA